MNVRTNERRVILGPPGGDKSFEQGCVVGADLWWGDLKCYMTVSIDACRCDFICGAACMSKIMPKELLFVNGTSSQALIFLLMEKIECFKQVPKVTKLVGSQAQ